MSTLRQFKGIFAKAKRLDLFGQVFTLTLKGRERTGTKIGVFATLVFSIIMLYNFCGNVLLVVNREVKTSTSSKYTHDLDNLPTLLGSEIDLRIVVDIEGRDW
jgi:hypothetical protein